MKIGIFSVIYGFGGQERLTFYLAKFLKERNHEVEILSWKKYKGLEMDIPYRTLFSKRIPPFDNIWFSPLIHSIKDNFDAYYNMTFGGSFFISKLIGLKKPTVHYFYKPPLETSTFFEKLAFSPIFLMEKIHKILKDIKVVCLSYYIREIINKFYNISPEVIYPPIDFEKFRPSKDKGNYILLSGRITSFKKFENALKFLNGEKVVLAGSISEIEYYKFLKKSFPSVKFYINVTDSKLIKLYQKCKLYIFTNPKEHFGIVPFEAMACEKTVLVPRGCGASELIKDGKNGYLFEADYSNFQEKLNEALNHDVGKKARKSIEKILSVENFGKKMLGLLSN